LATLSRSIVSKNLRPALCGVIDAQDFERLPVHPIQHDERRLWDDQLSRPGYAPSAAKFGVVAQNSLGYENGAATADSSLLLVFGRLDHQ
jgi:hypothetical protein